MTPENFVAQIRIAVVDENMTFYKKTFESTPVESAKHPYWKRALALYNSLDESSRFVLLEIMRQATVDTISTMFGLLDGSSWFDNQPEDFVLTTIDDPQQINGYLQDVFLADEDSGQR